jgi:hypothetical protein
MAYYESIACSVYGRADSTVEESFDGPLSDGIHFIYGKVKVKKNTVLDGSIVATGWIDFIVPSAVGSAVISAQQVPTGSPYYPAYYPAIVSYGPSSPSSRVKKEVGHNLTLTINGMVYSRGGCDLEACSINGPIVAKDINLAGSYTVTYDSNYALRPPGFAWPAGSFVAEVGSWSN